MPLGNSSSMRSVNVNGQMGTTAYSQMNDNPVFKVKVRSLATNYEQPNDNGDDNKNVKNNEKFITFRHGDIVDGVDFKGETHTGNVVGVEKDKERNVSSIIIIDDETEKKITLDPTTCKVRKKSKGNSEDQPPYYGESRLLNYNEFQNIQEKNKNI